MPLISAYLLPHGMQLIPNLDENSADQFRFLSQSFSKIINHLKQVEPDTVILISPHGIALEESFCIYMNKTARGYLPKLDISNVDGTIIKDQVNISIDLEFSKDLQQSLRTGGIKMDSCILGSQNYFSPLAWGESVPIYFVQEYLSTVNNVIISLPQTRYDYDKMSQDLSSFGEEIGKFCQKCQKRIAIIISGDLSHVHDAGSFFGFHSDGHKFDELICQWIKNPQAHEILSEAKKLNKTAKSCGISTLTILEGVINYDFQKNGVKWGGKLIAYDIPTYFGMGLSIFSPKKE